MKFCAILFYLLSATIVAKCSISQDAKRHVEECLEEFKLTKEELAILKRENSPELNCVFACIMKKRGSLIDGKVDAENMIETLKQMRVLSRGRTEEKVRRCAAAANAHNNECLVARDMIGCLFFEKAQ